MLCSRQITRIGKTAYARYSGTNEGLEYHGAALGMGGVLAGAVVGLYKASHSKNAVDGIDAVLGHMFVYGACGWFLGRTWPVTIPVYCLASIGSFLGGRNEKNNPVDYPDRTQERKRSHDQ